MSNEFRDLPPSAAPPERPVRPPNDSRAAASSEILTWGVIGIGLILVGTLILAIGSSADDGSAGGRVAALLGALLPLAGTLVTTVAVVAKGVQLGNRAS